MFDNIPEPPYYMPCYMVTPAYEVIDLSYMCGKAKKRPAVATESRTAFIERMARIKVDAVCADPLMGMSTADLTIARAVSAKGYDVGIYVEIATRANELKPDDCL